VNNARRFSVAAAVLALGAGTVVTVRSMAAKPPTSQYNIGAELELHDADIAFYQQRTRRDPTGALDHLHLAALYLQRARERGTPADINLAEAEARQSLANRRAHNDEAWHELALALMGEHRFLEARACADSLLAADSTATGPRGLIGEIDLELGRYSEADTIFTALDRPGAEPAVLARVARWASLRGRAVRARDLLLAAREKVHHRAGTPAEQVAWYDLRLGELALATGDLRDAADRLALARQIMPNDTRALIAEARLALARHDAAGALASANAAMNSGEDPWAFALASDAQLLLGDSAAANRTFRVFTTAISGVPAEAWHRQWRLELLDRNVLVPEVLAQATAELTTRPDVYGWDQYAWALHHAGRDADARIAMRHALQWGTEDVMFDAHARTLGVTR
jgi:hypothetical protein